MMMMMMMMMMAESWRRLMTVAGVPMVTDDRSKT
jgi:hypothetical protein